MKNSLYAIRVGLFFVIGLVLSYGVYLALSRKDLSENNGYHIKAIFNDMSTLSPNNDVRLAGVKIGRVKETTLQNGKGLAILVIDPRFSDIPSDSVATISMGNLLGSNYVAIEYGDPGSGFVKDGDTLRTKPTASIAAVLSQLDELGHKLNIAADSFSTIGEGPKNLFGKLNEIIDHNSAKIDKIIDNADVITQDIRDGKGSLGKLIETDDAHKELIAAVTEIRKAAEDTRKMIDNVNSAVTDLKNGQGVVGKLLYDKEQADKVAEIIGNLNEFSKKLNSDQGTLGKLASDDEIYRQLRALLSQAQQSLGSVGDSGPISAVGAAANGLF